MGFFDLAHIFQIETTDGETPSLRREIISVWKFRIFEIYCIWYSLHYAPMVPVYQYLSQVLSLVFISTVVMLDVWILSL